MQMHLNLHLHSNAIEENVAHLHLHLNARTKHLHLSNAFESVTQMHLIHDIKMHLNDFELVCAYFAFIVFVVIIVTI